MIGSRGITGRVSSLWADLPIRLRAKTVKRYDVPAVSSLNVALRFPAGIVCVSPDGCIVTM